MTTGADGDGIDGFNPLPTRRSGGTTRWRTRRPARMVSIRSRPGGREERADGAKARASPNVSIRSRPGGREEHAGIEHEVTTKKFQSAPDPEVGRNGFARLGRLHRELFQSAPDPEVGRNSRSWI